MNPTIHDTPNLPPPDAFGPIDATVGTVGLLAAMMACGIKWTEGRFSLVAVGYFVAAIAAGCVLWWRAEERRAIPDPEEERETEGWVWDDESGEFVAADERVGWGVGGRAE